MPLQNTFFKQNNKKSSTVIVSEYLQSEYELYKDFSLILWINKFSYFL